MSWLARLFSKTPRKRSPTDVDEDNLQPTSKRARALFQSSDPPSNPFKEESTEAFEGEELGALLCSSLVPRPLVLVASLDKQGNLNIVPSSFCTLISEEPAYISIGLEEKDLPEEAPADPASNIVQTKEFTVNIVSSWYHDAAVNTAGTYELPEGVEVEADLKTGVTTSASRKVGVPRVSEAAVTLECKLRHKYNIKDSDGDVASTVVIAEVVCITAKAGVVAQTSADGDTAVDAMRLSPVASLGRPYCCHISDCYSSPVQGAIADAAGPTTPPGAREREPTPHGEIAETVAAAVVEALRDEPEASAVREVQVTLAADTAAAGETEPLTVIVQGAEE